MERTMRFDPVAPLPCSNRLQSALLIGGVAIAVMVHVQRGSLINGLAEFQIQASAARRTTIEPEADARGRAAGAPSGLVSQRTPSGAHRSQWRTVEQVIDSPASRARRSTSSAWPGRAASRPCRSRFIRRGAGAALGHRADRRRGRGRGAPCLNDVLIGRKLANDFGIRVASDLHRQRPGSRAHADRLPAPLPASTASTRGSPT